MLLSVLRMLLLLFTYLEYLLYLTNLVYVFRLVGTLYVWLTGFFYWQQLLVILMTGMMILMRMFRTTEMRIMMWMDQTAWMNLLLQHRTSGYLVGTPCHVLDDGSTRAQLLATSRQTMSTAMLQKLKLARRTHGTTS